MEHVDLNDQAMVKDIQEKMYEMFPEVDWPEITREMISLPDFPDAIVQDYRANVLWSEDENGEENFNILAVTSPDYKFIPYEVAMYEFIEATKGFDGFGKPEFKASVLDSGGKFRGTASFPEAEMDIGKERKVGDLIAPGTEFHTSLDMGWAFRTLTFATRLACTNGMVSREVEAFMKKKHRGSLDMNVQFATIVPGLEVFGEQVEQWNRWGAIDINAKRAEGLIEDMSFGKRHQEQILALTETTSGMTLDQWLAEDKVNVLDMYNVFTQFVTHEIDSDMVRVRRADEIARVFDKAFAA